MKRYDNIQILRVLACLGVFISHLAPKMGAVGTTAKIANFGAYGVYLFFLVSAFLACEGLKDRDAAVSGSWDVKKLLRYYGKRALRILPLYYVVIFYNFLLHTFILQDVPVDPSGLRWFRYIFLTNAFIPAPDNFWGNLTATWTISLFMVFYLCAPFLIRAVGTENSGVIRAALLYISSVILQQVWNELPCSAYMMCFYYINFFMLGIFVWQLSKCGKKGSAAAVLAGVCVGLAGLLYIWKGEIPYFTGISWIYAFIVLGTMKFSWKRALRITGMAKTVSLLRDIFAVLDKHSYEIYLVHAVIVEGMVLVMAHIPLGGLAVGVISVVLTAAGVAAAHLIIEKPVGKLSRRI